MKIVSVVFCSLAALVVYALTPTSDSKLGGSDIIASDGEVQKEGDELSRNLEIISSGKRVSRKPRPDRVESFEILMTMERGTFVRLQKENFVDEMSIMYTEYMNDAFGDEVEITIEYIDNQYLGRNLNEEGKLDGTSERGLGRRSLISRFRGISLCRRCPRKRVRDPLYDAGTKRASRGNRKKRTTRRGLVEDQNDVSLNDAIDGFADVIYNTFLDIQEIDLVWVK